MRLCASAAAVALLLGCGRPAAGGSPGAGEPDARVRRTLPPSDAAPSAVVVAAAASASARPVDAGLDADPGDARRGGNWSRCYAGFTAGSKPALDVTRLGILCGPSNGMRRVPELPADRGWDAKSGECFRLFLASRGGDDDALDVAVVDAGGHRVAAASGRRWLVVGADAPFCVESDGRYRIVVQRGNPALELWRLR